MTAYSFAAYLRLVALYSKGTVTDHHERRTCLEQQTTNWPSKNELFASFKKQLNHIMKSEVKALTPHSLRKTSVKHTASSPNTKQKQLQYNNVLLYTDPNWHHLTNSYKFHDLFTPPKVSNFIMFPQGTAFRASKAPCLRSRERKKQVANETKTAKGVGKGMEIENLVQISA